MVVFLLACRDDGVPLTRGRVRKYPVPVLACSKITWRSVPAAAQIWWWCWADGRNWPLTLGPNSAMIGSQWTLVRDEIGAGGLQ